MIQASLPGDELLPDASMTFDRRRTLPASPEAVWPWIVQLGKRRAGWYLPGVLERRIIPARYRATWVVDPRWHALAVGDRIPDYGGRNETLQVVQIDPPHALVYRSERRGACFTWALILTPVTGGQSELHLRFRGSLRSTGWRRRIIITVGEFFDRVTAELMLTGLAERLELAA